jgi:hypothetical protein
MTHSLLSTISLLIALIILSFHPQANGSDDGIYVSNTKVIEATVDFVNAEKCTVVLRGKEGKLYPVEVGEGN